MNNLRVLIYIDILGFYELAKEIAQNKNLDDFNVRTHFISVIQQKIEKQEKNYDIIVKRNLIGDDWLLLLNPRDITDSIDLAYKIIIDILNHQTFFKESEYKKIPLEIGLGTIEWKNKWDNINNFNFNLIEPTILFLKSNLINYFHEWYHENKNQRIKSTFIIITESLFNLLDFFDKKLCKKVTFKIRTNEIVFYEVDVKEIEYKGKIYKFLEKIDEKHNRSLAKINQLFVPPFKYEEIKNKLKENGIIFISGSPEYGKTFTSVKILWDFFINFNCEPKWFKGNEPIERKSIRKRLENIQAELKEKTIIYFEDPFGKFEYEPRESLEREIKTIIEVIKHTKSLYVIITSRDEIFEIFKRKSISKDFLEIYEEKINISGKSYNFQKRKQILTNWAFLENSKWLSDEKLKNYVFEAIKEEEILPTILNIKDFVLVASKTFNIDDLKNKLLDKSVETVIAFSKEIKKMSYDKQLFLFLIFLLEYYKIDIIQKLYDILIKKLEILNALEFFEVIDWFKDKKITYDGEIIRFVHASYFNTLEFLTNKEGYFLGKFNNKFRNLVEILSITKESANGIIKLLLKNYDNFLVPNASDILLKMASNDDTQWGFVYNLEDYFNDLPSDFRNNLIEILSNGYDDLVINISDLLLFHFYDIPENLRDQILVRIITIGEIPEYLTWVMEKHFDEIPENLRNELLKLLANEKEFEELEILEEILLDHFNLIPKKLRNEILNELIDDEHRSYFAITPILKYFNQIPQKIQAKLVYTAESEITADHLALELSNHFLEIPKDLRENLVLKLSKIETEFMDVAKLFAIFYNEIPEKLRYQIIFNLQDNEAAAYEISNFITTNYNDLPIKIKSVIFNIANNENTAWGLPAPLIKNYNTLSVELKNLLIKLCNEKQNTLTLPWILTYHYDKIKIYSDEILLKLIEKNQLANNVAWALAHNFNCIPKYLSEDLINKIINNNSAVEGLLAIFMLNHKKIDINLRKKILEAISKNFKDLRIFPLDFHKKPGFNTIDNANKRNFLKLLEDPDPPVSLSYLWSRELDWGLQVMRDHIQNHSDYYKKWLKKLKNK